MNRVPTPAVTIDGFHPDELLALPGDELDALVVCGRPLVFRIGTAEVLARFWVEDGILVLELGHIDGGGEGVLPTLARVAERYARGRGLVALDWRAHALNCARPNPKLRRVLGRRGFRVADVPGTGPCLRLAQPIIPARHGEDGGSAPVLADHLDPPHKDRPT